MVVTFILENDYPSSAPLFNIENVSNDKIVWETLTEIKNLTAQNSG